MFAKPKFDSLPLRQRHKKAAELLRAHHTNPSSSSFAHYLDLASWLELSPIANTFEEISNRFHEHMRLAEQELSEAQLLISRGDTLSRAPFLPHTIYLDNLRSAHNVGSILRTTEALRLGSIYYGGQTPTTTHPKVIATSMGTAELVPTATHLPKPWIALETSGEPFTEFAFPEEFTLILGNEERGISEQMLSQADHVISIPLFGGKNSLNVACAYAAIATQISRVRTESV
ncbi:MAG: TrmH family RNA methyltransferase [Simkaniaceae bacterium]|nr:TrmH family RNA methyltransferase [Simkaniaceae bacterium]